MTKPEVFEMFTKACLNKVSRSDFIYQLTSQTKIIIADQEGLININRFYDDVTETVALRRNISSVPSKIFKLSFDYADYLHILTKSKNLSDKETNFQPPVTKGDKGRVFNDDASIDLNLRKGSSKLVFVLSHSKILTVP